MFNCDIRVATGHFDLVSDLTCRASARQEEESAECRFALAVSERFLQPRANHARALSLAMCLLVVHAQKTKGERFAFRRVKHQVQRLIVTLPAVTKNRLRDIFR